MHLIGLDLETSGLNAETDHVIEVAIVHFDHFGEILEEWSSLIKPPCQISEFTSRLTGITNEMLETAPSLDEMREIITEKIGDAPIMGHFISFDIGFLNAKKFNLTNTALDSCQLAQSFLWQEPSYSLEVLAKKLEVTQDNAHRALDDVKANIDVLFHLCEHIKTLTKDEKKLLKKLYEKSTWAWAEFILPILEMEGGTAIAQSEAREKKHSDEKVDLKKCLEENGASGDFNLLEELHHTGADLLKYSSELEGPVYLCVKNPEQIPHNENLGHICHPSEYLDEEKFAAQIEKNELSDWESILFTKISLWKNQTKTGLKNEIRIVREEKDLWQNIACEDNSTPKSFYKKALDHAMSKKIRLINHGLFLKDRSKKTPSIINEANLVIGNLEHLPDTIDKAWHIKFNDKKWMERMKNMERENKSDADARRIELLQNKLDIFFGLTGMAIKKYGDQNDFENTLSVENHHRNTAEFEKMKQSAAMMTMTMQEWKSESENWSEKQTNLEKEITYLEKILSGESDILWISHTAKGDIWINSFPSCTKELFEERIWKNLKSMHLFCHFGKVQNNFDFIKRELGLPEKIIYASDNAEKDIDFEICENQIASPKEIGNIEDCGEELKIHLQKWETNAFLLVNSKRAAEDFFSILGPISKEFGFKLFVQNMGGGMGKIAQMAKNAGVKSLFVGDLSLMNFLLEESINLHHLAIHKLPFSHPQDHIQKAKTLRFKNVYQEYALPQSELNLNKIIDVFLGEQSEGKSILILDPRHKF